MKKVIYILSLSALLWIFFNPNGILTYNSLNSSNIREEKKRDKVLKNKNIKQGKINWLNDYLLSINTNNKEVQSYYKNEYKKEIVKNLIQLNIFKKGTQVFNIKE